VSVYKRVGTKYYSYDFRFKGERIQVATHLTNQEAAKNAEAAHRVRLAEGRLGIHRASAIPLFGAFADRFLEWARHHYAERPNTLKFHQQQLRTLRQTFDDLRLDAITVDLVERYKFRRLSEARRNLRATVASPATVSPATVSPATVNRELATLKFLFHQAQRWGLPVQNPVAAVSFNAEPPGPIRVVTPAEERKYLAKAAQPLRDIAALMLETGMRPEEVFRLTPENIDLGRGLLTNPHGKTRAARRVIPLTKAAREILARRLRANGQGLKIKSKSNEFLDTPEIHQPKGRRIPAEAKSRRVRTRASGTGGTGSSQRMASDAGAPTLNFLFPGRFAVDHLKSVRKRHDAVVTRAGLHPRFRLYDFRHTFATRAVEAGVELPVLKELLGHTDIRMTMRYVHPSDRAKREAIQKMEARK
jgi:integrase